MELNSRPLSGVTNGSDSGSVVGLAGVVFEVCIFRGTPCLVCIQQEHSNRQTDILGTRSPGPPPCSRTVSEEDQLALQNGQTLPSRRIENWNVYLKRTLSTPSPGRCGISNFTWTHPLT